MYEHATFTCLTHCNIIIALNNDNNNNSSSSNVIVQFSLHIMRCCPSAVQVVCVLCARCHHLFGHLADYCADGKIISFEMFQNAAGKVASYNNSGNNYRNNVMPPAVRRLVVARWLWAALVPQSKIVVVLKCFWARERLRVALVFVQHFRIFKELQHSFCKLAGKFSEIKNMLLNEKEKKKKTVQ